MIKFSFKSLLSAVLAIAIIVLSLSSAFAAGCSCDTDPIVFINGINATPLYLHPGTDEAEEVFPPDGETIKNAVLKALIPGADTILGINDENTYKRLTDAIEPIFGIIALNPDGTSKYDVGIQYQPSLEPGKHKRGEWYNYAYDWRLDVHTLANQLRDYVIKLKQATGHDHVKLIGFSMGACVLSQYLATYGFDDVSGVVYLAGAHNGVAVCGEPMSGRVDTDSKALVSFLNTAMGTDDSMKAVKDALMFAYKSGLIDLTIDALRLVYDRINDTVAARIALDYFVPLPGMLCLMSRDDYNVAKEYIFRDDASKEDNAALIASLDDYHYNVQANITELTAQAIEKTGHFATVAKYTGYVTPVIKDTRQQSDGVILTKDESNGAICADVDSDLGKDYKQAVTDGHDHVSDDNMIDASTCLYPEMTWFVKGAEHSHNNYGVQKLIAFVFFSDHQVNVFENSRYPQFLVEDGDDLIPVTEQNADLGKPENIGGLFMLLEYIKIFLKMIKDIIETVINAGL